MPWEIAGHTTQLSSDKHRAHSFAFSPDVLLIYDLNKINIPPFSSPPLTYIAAFSKYKDKSFSTLLSCNIVFYEDVLMVAMPQFCVPIQGVNFCLNVNFKSEGLTNFPNLV